MKESQPLVSVIVPNYNHSEFLEERLESIYGQTLQDFEVILLDDCSTDYSREILLKYKDHPKTALVVFNKQNSGSTFLQWDKGIKLAIGKYIWIAETDDYCDSNFLEKIVAPFRKDSEVALSFCQSHSVNRNGKITGNWKGHTSGFNTNSFLDNFIMDGNIFIEKFLIHKNVIPNVSAVLFRKKQLEEISPLIYKPFMKYNADWFYYIQIICNYKIAFVSESLNYFRYHEDSVIARAGGESGWIKIFKMELEGRSQMLSYIKNCTPANLHRIEEEAEIGSNKLSYLIAKGYLDHKYFIPLFSIVYRNPFLWKRVGMDLIRKFKRKCLAYLS